MGEIVQFPGKAENDLDWGIDLPLAVDVAIRDLRDIESACATVAARVQAVACRLMLERALQASSR